MSISTLLWMYQNEAKSDSPSTDRKERNEPRFVLTRPVNALYYYVVSSETCTYIYIYIYLFFTTSLYLLSVTPFCRAVQYACRTRNYISSTPVLCTATPNRGANTEHNEGASSFAFRSVRFRSMHVLVTTPTTEPPGGPSGPVAKEGATGISA